MKLISPIINIRRHFLRKNIEIKIEVYNKLCEILVTDPVIHVDEFNGIFLIDKRSTLFRRILVEGYYEPKLTKYCSQYIDFNKDVIDVGANIGFYSVLCAKRINHCNKVLSIEPTKNAFEKLIHNLKLNEVNLKVISYNGVASNIIGEVEINTVIGKEEYSSLGAMSHPSISRDSYTSCKVESSTIDSLVEKYSLKPGFIKIDVEGAENLVLEGCQKVLTENHPVILMEVSDALLKQNGSSAKGVIDMISSYGYDIIDPAFPKELPGGRSYGDILCIPK
ncbi:MAG: FkbM family methyltransferase [Nostoc sp.]